MMVSALYAGYPQDAFATVNEVQAVMQSDPVKGQVVHPKELLQTLTVTSRWKMQLKVHW